MRKLRRSARLQAALGRDFSANFVVIRKAGFSCGTENRHFGLFPVVRCNLRQGLLSANVGRCWRLGPRATGSCHADKHLCFLQKNYVVTAKFPNLMVIFEQSGKKMRKKKFTLYQ